MAAQIFNVGLILILYIAQCVRCQPSPLLLADYTIELFSQDRILSTVIWLRPPICLYEQWMLRALDPSIATRNTSYIKVQVKIKDNNTTYMVPNQFSIPQCRSTFGEPPPTEDYVLQVGPDLINQASPQVIRILPGTTYYIRYALHSSTQQIAITNWSLPFQTHLPQSPKDMYSSLQGRSGGMVVITVLLSISMFMLMTGLAVTFATHK